MRGSSGCRGAIAVAEALRGTKFSRGVKDRFGSGLSRALQDSRMAAYGANASSDAVGRIVGCPIPGALNPPDDLARILVQAFTK
jgi:hypothetical protein